VALRRVLPFALPVALWAAGTLAVRAAAPVHAARLEPVPGHLLAAFAHLPQALLGIEHPARWFTALDLLATPIPALVLLTLALLAVREPQTPAAAPSPLGFALGWLVLFTLPVVPVAYAWSSYYYTLAAVGGAVAVGWFGRRLARPVAVAAVALLLVVHAQTSALAAFAVTDNPWNPVSRLTAHYFARGAALSRQLAAALRRVEPAPPPHTRFFFATLPPWAGFQAGNGAAIRNLYRDDTLESWFYSAFSETTAAQHPCVFLFWNGIDFERLYAASPDPLFQVGTDLLLLERPHGARHAFRRGLEAGESRADHLYWLGWAALECGDRAMAERAWLAWGARDDSTARTAAFARARTALAAADTLAARRALLGAVRAGVGWPDAHAELGVALRTVQPKYALLETRVAVLLDSTDWLSRRELVQGLTAARLDDAARGHLTVLRRIHPDFAADTLATGLARRLRARAPDARDVLEFAASRGR
jgi:hypothetical protein